MTQKKPASPLHALSKWLAEPVMVIGLTIFATTALAQPFYVPTGSMQPTIAIGGALIGNKFAYGYSRYSLPYALGPASEKRFLAHAPRRGDVIVFRLPRDPKVTYVKRLIGLPGDRIQMVHGRLVINGDTAKLTDAGTGKVEDGYGAFHEIGRFTETLPGGVSHPIFKAGWDGPLDDTQVFVVPAGHYFMMGDNRDNSLDSRVAAADGGVGFVPAENLMARADLNLGSYDYLNAHPVTAWLRRIHLSKFLHSI